MQPPLVEVAWTDCCTYSGWRDADEAIEYKIMQCKSVGYLLDKSPVMISIAQSLADNGEVAEVTCIPAEVVIEVRELCRVE
jgi:hypothetical protein